MANGVLTNRTFLMQSSDGSAYTKLVDVLTFPDLGGTPENIDITTLSDGERHYMNGINEIEPLTFTALYNPTDYAAVKALENIQNKYWGVWFGGTSASVPTGSNGKWSFQGELSVVTNGGNVNEATQMTITILPNSPLTFSSGT